MEAAVLIVFVGFIIFVFARFIGNSQGFDDPKPMTNERIISAIAGQADWLEKMSRAPIQSQQSASILELSRKRRDYISQLCVELLTRTHSPGDLKYPGASESIDAFAEVKEFAKQLESSGISKEVSAVRSVKQKLFQENDQFYPASWEN